MNPDEDVTLTTENDLEVSLELEAPKQGEPSGEAEIVKSLEAQLAKSKQDSAERLNAANRQIAEAIRTAQTKEQELQATRKDAVSATLESLTKDQDAAKRDLQAAYEAADWGKVSDLQVKIADNSALIVEMKRGKAALDEPVSHQQPVAPVNPDPVEQVALTLSPKSAEWIRAHPDAVRNPSLNQMLMGAHGRAVELGHAIDTPEYFGFIEQALGYAKPAQQRQAPSRQAAPIAAPSSRSSAPTPQRTATPNTVRLTAQEQDIARANGMSNQEYAKYKVELINEGKITAPANW